MKTYKSFKSELIKDKEVRKAYNELGAEFDVLERLIERRIKSGLSQAELAERVGTKQSAISRFESGSYNPTIQFLHKVANALGSQLKIIVK